jgi:hypothetical protein
VPGGPERPLLPGGEGLLVEEHGGGHQGQGGISAGLPGGRPAGPRHERSPASRLRSGGAGGHAGTSAVRCSAARAAGGEAEPTAQAVEEPRACSRGRP